MAIYLGEDKVKGLYLGEDAVKSAYLGTDKVFGTAEPSFPDFTFRRTAGAQFQYDLLNETLVYNTLPITNPFVYTATPATITIIDDDTALFQGTSLTRTTLYPFYVPANTYCRLTVDSVSAYARIHLYEIYADNTETHELLTANTPKEIEMSDDGRWFALGLSQTRSAESTIYDVELIRG